MKILTIAKDMKTLARRTMQYNKSVFLNEMETYLPAKICL